MALIIINLYWHLNAMKMDEDREWQTTNKVYSLYEFS
jgi:hypothetical protein